MIRQQIFCASLFLASTLVLSARTWSSFDGERSFEGELQNYDSESGEVTVLVDGQTVSLQQENLSEEDVLFLKNWEPETVADEDVAMSGNPVFPGWYADPEGIIFDDQYWIYPTYSAPYGQQTFFDCFSSPDLVTWK
jgi:hypothetical protein